MNKYLIDKEIGKGKFGVVYKGIVKKNGTTVAIKMENNNINTLRYEATILQYLANCSIESIPKVHWYGIDCDNKYLVMDYYDMTLSNYVRAMFSKYGENEKTMAQIDRLFDRMVEIIESVHNCKILHRDIKPDNFMVCNSDIYIIDFGMATSVVEKYPINNHTTIIGTPTWISYFIHDGYNPHYRDDLISAGYIYLSWRCPLPWVKSLTDRESLLVENGLCIDYTDIRHPTHQLRKKYKTWLNVEMLCTNAKIRDFLYKYYHFT